MNTLSPVRSLVLDRKPFKIDLIDFEPLSRVEEDGTRYYATEDGNKYPSVTTVLGAMTDKTALEEWRKRVGDAEADRVSRFASTRGTNIHTMCEDYVLGNMVDSSRPTNLIAFKQLKSVLDRRIDNIRGIESMLVSHHLKVAGTCDLIADFDDELTIIDYKTSAKLKRKEWIEGYFLQASLYSYMLWEMTGLMAKKLAVLIAVDDNPEPQVFIEYPRNYAQKATDLVKKYHERLVKT